MLVVILMQKSEHRIQQEIELALSKHHCTVFRTNVGQGFLITFKQIIGKTANGNYIVKAPLHHFSAGLPKGHPDLYGFRWVDNQVFYIEVKNAIGKPSEDQIRFHNFLQSHNVIHGIARSAKEALMIVDGGLVGYGYEVS